MLEFDIKILPCIIFESILFNIIEPFPAIESSEDVDELIIDCCCCECTFLFLQWFDDFPLVGGGIVAFTGGEHLLLGAIISSDGIDIAIEMDCGVFFSGEEHVFEWYACEILLWLY